MQKQSLARSNLLPSVLRRLRCQPASPAKLEKRGCHWPCREYADFGERINLFCHQPLPKLPLQDGGYRGKRNELLVPMSTTKNEEFGSDSQINEPKKPSGILGWFSSKW